MKKAVVLFSICFIFMGHEIMFAQDNDDIPYLSDSDIMAIETFLSEDASFEYKEEEPVLSAGGKTTANEMSRLNTSQPIYHLLVLDRAFSPNSDISDMKSMRILYKYRHGRNGYLIALYMSSKDGPVFPQLPAGSRIILNLSSMRLATIRDYINSNAFRKFVTNRTILRQLLEAMRKR